MNRTWTMITALVGGRKFLVFLAATGLLIGRLINQDTWLWVVLIYIGGNVAEQLTDKLQIKVEGK